MSRRGGPRSTARAITAEPAWTVRYHVSDAGARQPSPRRYPGWGQHGFGCVGGQRLPLGGDRGGAEAKGLRSRIHRKGRRNKPLSEREKQGNKTRSSVRVRVEHVFGAQSNDWAGRWYVVPGAGEGADRVEEPRLQHAPPGPTGASRGGARRRRPPGDGLVAEITQLERHLRLETLFEAHTSRQLVKQYLRNSPILRGDLIAFLPSWPRISNSVSPEAVHRSAHACPARTHPGRLQPV